MTSSAPWREYQARLETSGGTALFVTRADAASAVAGHERITVYQSDPPFPSVFLPRVGPPHVCTPDPDGAMHLPADHVHPILFDTDALARQLPVWLGDAAAGPAYVDICSPGGYQKLQAALPGVELRDAAALLGPPAGPGAAADPPRPEIASARRTRFLDAADRLGVDGWYLRTPEAARAAGEEPRPHLDLAVIPDTGRVAIDRASLDDLSMLRDARPQVEWVDVGPVVAAASLPRTDVELATLHEGSRRSERALAAALEHIQVGMTERHARELLRTEARAVGLHADHIDHVWRVLPRDRAAAPWLRGDWAGQAPWSQLTSERPIAIGDHLAVDLGFWFEGAMTDVGWTLIAGRDPSPEEAALARRWLDVADRVTDAITPGATAADLRMAALTGWTEAHPPWPFGLYVAHGVGFTGVEPPFAGTDLGVPAEHHMPIAEGQVIMIEPYIYVDGVGGYRAERCVRVTADGCEIWTELPVESFGQVG
jgi:Xaa-Pro aminopeptidase